MKFEPIIKSILDNDLYKISMLNFALELFPNVNVQYKFKNRGKQRFNKDFLEELQKQINCMKNLSLTKDEYNWMKENIPYLKSYFCDYLYNYRFNPENVNLSLTEDNNLDLSIEGKWIDTILWEVPLLALISELYFKIIDTNWDNYLQDEKSCEKYITLSQNNCNFSEFGTRRRRSFENQENVINNFVECKKYYQNKVFKGTSNVFLAKKYNLTPIGTYAHEACQAMSALESLNHANYFMMQNWTKVFNVDLGIALTDTYTTDLFLKDFNKRFCTLFQGVRQDSGNVYEFTDKIIKHYKKMGIDPMTKKIIFSDNLNTEKCVKIAKYCENKIQCFFGIGTNFTNDFFDSPALNMVIKLHSCNNFPVVKISDDEGKETGDIEAIKNMKWIIKNTLKENQYD